MMDERIANMNITEFLEARTAEDESLAQAAIKSHAPDEVWESELGDMNLWPEDIAFWASQTPYRVLAEFAAKRAVISFHHYVSDGLCSTCVETGPDAQAFPCDTLKALAAVYKDHPDYQQEWSL